MKTKRNVEPKRSYRRTQASFVIATIIPITTNTTIAICVQIQVGDMAEDSLARAWVPGESAGAHRARTAAPRAVYDYRIEMTRRLRESTVALMLALCMLAWLPPATGAKTAPSALRSTTAPLGGVNIVGVGAEPLSEADRAIAQARALHAKVVRTGVPWSVLEPAAPGQIEPRALAFADRLVSDAAADGIRVIMLVYSSPCWASSAPAALLRQCINGSGQANGWPPRNPTDYAAFVAYLAQRYGTRLAAIEIWNEPDQANQAYFAGPDKPQRYAAILRAAYPAIKQVSPNVPVLAGSLVGSNGVFLRALYAAGIKGYYDGLAVHFYNLTLASLRSIHEVQLANGDTKPLWLDEFGWSSCYPRHRTQQEQGCVTTQTQALNLINTFRALAHTSYIAAEILYKLQGSAQEEFGVLSSSGARKPAFAALSKVLASPFGPVSPVTLSLRKQGSRVLASGSGPVGDYMELEAFQGSRLRYRALFVLDRFNRYSIALPAVLGTSGLRVRVYQYWAGRGKDAQRSI
jgi:polysaccharide biosynthesis protein PslG